MVWAMVIFFHVGVMGGEESNSVTTLTGFQSRDMCQTASSLVRKQASASKKVDTVCVQLTK